MFSSRNQLSTPLTSTFASQQPTSLPATPLPTTTPPLSTPPPRLTTTFASQPLSSQRVEQLRRIARVKNSVALFTKTLDIISLKIPNKIKISKKVLNQLIKDLGSESFDSTRTNINYMNNNSKNINLISNASTRSFCFVLKENDQNKNLILKNVLDLCIIYESIYNMNKDNLQSYTQGNNWVYLIILYLTKEQLIKPELNNINSSNSLKLIIIYQLVFNDSIKTILNKNLDIEQIILILNKYLLPSFTQNDTYIMIFTTIFSLFQGRQSYLYNENDGKLIDNLDFYNNLFMNICKIYEGSFDNTVMLYNKKLPPLNNNYSSYSGLIITKPNININKKINLMTFEYIFVWLLNIIKKIKFRTQNSSSYNYPEILALPDFSIEDNFNLYNELKTFRVTPN
jgi:hypothetical protein